MSRYLLQHRHEPHECGVVFAAFKTAVAARIGLARTVVWADAPVAQRRYAEAAGCGPRTIPTVQVRLTQSRGAP